MIWVRALPPSFDREYYTRMGENEFCDQWDITGEQHGLNTCSGRPEIELRNAPYGKTKWRLLLCREHAGYVAEQLLEVIELVDGGELMRWQKEKA